MINWDRLPLQFYYGLNYFLKVHGTLLQEKLIEKVPGEILWPQAYDELFERDYNTIEQEIEDFRRARRSR